MCFPRFLSVVNPEMRKLDVFMQQAVGGTGQSSLSPARGNQLGTKSISDEFLRRWRANIVSGLMILAALAVWR